MTERKSTLGDRMAGPMEVEYPWACVNCGAPRSEPDASVACPKCGSHVVATKDIAKQLRG